jgi:8-oxo-dGTP pyrophosphatase MutT (NUDIX family)
MLQRPLPGRSAQDRMSPQTPAHYQSHHGPPPADCRQGAVIILLYPKDGQLHFVLTRRSNHLPHHRGQVSLPGGAREGDERLTQTALREAEEELGVSMDDIDVIGCLSPFYVPPSNFCVHPCIASLDMEPVFEPSPDEIEEILEVPLADLVLPENRRVEYWDDPNFSGPRRVPLFDFQQWIVWGATAMILIELMTIIDDYRAGSELAASLPIDRANEAVADATSWPSGRNQ